MITDSTVQVYTRTVQKNSRGQVTNGFTFLKSTQANLQPIALNSTTSAQWGQVNLTADSRIMFFYPDIAVKKLDRVIDAYGITYEIRNINPWGSPPFGHFEALLMPVQGDDGIVPTPVPSGGSGGWESSW